MQAGRFRKDFYYRLCADMIATPSLAEQLADAPDNLPNLIRFIARRWVPDDADPLADEVQSWIEKHVGRDYPWPGNFRELEQCVKNVMVRGQYHPSQPAAKSEAEQLVQQIGQGALAADNLLRRYCTLTYNKTRSYEETARRLALDRRTVKAKVTGATADT